MTKHSAQERMAPIEPTRAPPKLVSRTAAQRAGTDRATADTVQTSGNAVLEPGVVKGDFAAKIQEAVREANGLMQQLWDQRDGSEGKGFGEGEE